ncbi:USP34 [Lepeophtheirus salmonis]|uniref:USP34 n=1 Tax=Lepeophtheirus salmonis TaxID=72036 RepID=A0A7R8D337_LEPSM|nr:USP34 [Lepeophtheirus salmonis]CAF2961669.1 USP34 [Lepeophtheirus salmonis]
MKKGRRKKEATPGVKSVENCVTCCENQEEESQDEDAVQFVLKEGPDLISKAEIGALYRYLNAWVSNRQCHCLFKEGGLTHKFASSLESLIGVALYLIKNLGAPPSSLSWATQEIERLLQFLSKVFMLQFPLYSGFKHSGLRPPDVSQGKDHRFNQMREFFPFLRGQQYSV